MKGALPVPYIVSLIIAAIVIGVLVYWFVKTVALGGGEASEEMCRANLMQACIGKSDDYTINPNNFDKCKGTQIAKEVRKCGDLI